MPDVVILGAGPLGGTLAHALASRDRVRDVCLIDDAGTVAEGKALDITQAAPIEGFSTRVCGSSHLHLAARARVVVLADDARGRPWQGETALAMIKRLDEQNPDALFLCADASQPALIGQAVSELRLDRRRLVGSSPHAFRAGARALVALHADRSPAEVSLEIAGAAGDLFALWSSATVAGRAAHEAFTRPQQLSLDARLVRLWPPGTYAQAGAAARFCDALINGSAGTLTGFVCLADELGAATRGSVAALPLRVGPGGVEAVLVPTLSARERVRLENGLFI